jgi:hypothetical protein
MFKRRRLVTQHDLKGLLLGWRGALDPNDNSWQDDTVPYDTEAGRIVFYPGVAFADTSDDSTVVREQLKIVAALTGDLTHIKSTRKVLDQIVGQYLHMASFFEQHLCDWFRVDIEGRGNEEKGFSLSSYKRLAATKSFELYHIKKYAGQYASLLPIAVKKFNFLAEAVRTNVDKAINQMLYGASSDQSIENKLVYLHSCLDIMIKTVGDSKDWLQKSEGFSRKLVLACEDTGIQWLDLYPYLNKQAIFSNEKVDFRINQYRNQIIHEGTYPEFNQYQELTEENSRARALFERLVMAVLGMYDQNSPIGQLRIN